jgi:glycine betaine/proline transport system substrate-binding protein
METHSRHGHTALHGGKGERMMQPRLWFVVGVAVALVGAACSDVQEGGSAGGGGGGGSSQVAQCGSEPINLAQSPWTGAAANTYVAKVILEQEMGCTVEVSEIDEFAQFPAMAKGDVDGTLEVWPSGHQKDYKRYIEGEGGVVDGGKLGVVGNIGWWVPTYVVESNQDVSSWKTLKGNEDLFKTSETGGAGQFLASDPSFVSFDGEIIENLGLDLEVVQSGSEAASLTALAKAYKAKDPILMYFWTPHWAQAKYDLTEVELPAYNQKCETAATERDGDGYACDYADDVLYKAFSDQFESKDAAAFELLSNMQYSNEDQNEIALNIDDRGMKPEAAAQAWVDENKAVWEGWLPAS